MSKRASFTPGPWTIDWNVARLDVFSADASRLVATLRRSALSSVIDSSAIANARLISSCPDLLEALHDACLTYAVHGDQPPQKWLDAIAKATGEQS
jgi:hypothetical protein